MGNRLACRSRPRDPNTSVLDNSRNTFHRSGTDSAVIRSLKDRNAHLERQLTSLTKKYRELKAQLQESKPKDDPLVHIPTETLTTQGDFDEKREGTQYDVDYSTTKILEDNCEKYCPRHPAVPVKFVCLDRKSVV